MQKFYYLSTCSTCNRIIKELNLAEHDVDLHDIKSNSITAEQLDELKDLSGSYEALFSRRSMKFRPMGLHERSLSETDYRELILQEYTFLKRPVLVLDREVFVGNSAKVVAAAKMALKQ
jgi:arsenate reductase